MNKKVEARIYWKTEAQGGRKSIPYGDKYAPIIKIKNVKVKPEDYWSVFVFNREVLCENETLADLEYLSDVAPDNLFDGVEFFLYEGKKEVASGIVLKGI